MCNSQNPQPQPITVPRGSTYSVGLALTDAAGDPYVLAPGEFLRLGVKASPMTETDYLVEVINDGQTDARGNFVFTLPPEATAELEFKIYYYDIGLQSGEDYEEVIPTSYFIVALAVTERSTE